MIHYEDCIQSLIMRKLNSQTVCKEEVSTRSSKISPDRQIKNHSKNVTPFSYRSQSRSPYHRRIEQSPLQVPLALAISKLTGAQVRSERDLFDKKISFTELLNESKNHSQISALQLQNIKNILQQFMQSLYNNMQREISQKFNVEMKRMILKYRETDSILRKMQQMVVVNADIIQLQENFRIKLDVHERKYSNLVAEIDRLKGQLQNQRRQNDKKQKEIMMLKQELKRATSNLQKYENAMFRKIQQVNKSKVQQNSLNCDSQRFLTEHNYTHTSIQQYYRDSIIIPRWHQKNKQNFNLSNMMQNSNNMNSSRVPNVNKLHPSLSPLRGSKKGRSPQIPFVVKKPYENSYTLIKKDIAC